MGEYRAIDCYADHWNGCGRLGEHIQETATQIIGVGCGRLGECYARDRYADHGVGCGRLGEYGTKDRYADQRIRERLDGISPECSIEAYTGVD